MMNVCNYVCYMAGRGQGKTFLIAIFCVCRCILYPGTQICLAAGTKGQSINILQKIKNLLIPGSPQLANEIKGQVSTAVNNACCTFKNGSFIKVVTASDTSRSNRANICVCDEFRMIAENTVNTVLRRFLSAPRHAGFMDLPEYSGMKERNKQVYLSSAYFQNHWSYNKFVDYFKSMLNDKKKYFVCGLPYQLSIEQGLYMAEQAADEMSEATFNEVQWSMQQQCLFYGDTDGAFYNYDVVAKNRKIKYAMLPDYLAGKFSSKHFVIPKKQPGEIRVISADLALMSSNKNNNDATAIFVNQGIPGQDRRYYSNIVYADSTQGQVTSKQALRIRRLFEWYDADYIVIDGKGVGLGIVDALLDDIFDPDTGQTYPALSCCNNAEIASRCSNANAQKALWVINNQTAKFNSDCAFLLRQGLKSGRIRLLIDEYDAEQMLRQIKGYGSLNPIEKVMIKAPYEQTTLLIDELINLKYEQTNVGVKIYETSGRRKDRYSSLSYNYWVMCQLQDKARSRRSSTLSIQDLCKCIRAPKIK